MSKRLSKEAFEFVRASTPLVSFDLIIQNERDEILLGRRRNEPAAGFWFVPGGRVRKDETFSDSFSRIVRDELSGWRLGAWHKEPCLETCQSIGTYEHHYPPTVRDTKSIHYVVLGMRLPLTGLVSVPHGNDQHIEWKWFSVRELIECPSVHQNTKAYFVFRRLGDDSQYQVLSDRRTSHDNLHWQVPPIMLAAQAFLFAVTVDGDKSAIFRLTAGVLGGCSALASIQLMKRHRYFEVAEAELLAEHESWQGWEKLHGKRYFESFVRPRGLAVYNSHFWWVLLLCAFFLANVIACGIVVFA